MNDTIPRGTSSSRGLLVLVAVFVAGAVAGTAIDRYYVSRRSLGLAAERGWVRAESRRDLGPAERRSLQTGIPIPIVRLGLTADQETRLSEIARRRRPQSDSILASLRPLVRQVENQMMQEMLCALTPPQQAHWLALMDSTKFDPDIVTERYRPVRTHTCASLPK